MKKEKINQLSDDLSRALKRLSEACRLSGRQTIVVDAVIQRFEFSFELSWKLMKEVLAYDGIDALSPRAVIKEGFRTKLINDGDAWIDMLEDRNKTSHIYDEKQANDIYVKIKKRHLPLMLALNEQAIERLKNGMG